MDVLILIIVAPLFIYIRFHDVIHEIIYHIRLSRPLSQRYLQPIIKFNHFYNYLPEASRKRFRKKVREFLLNKKFVPRQMPAVTDEMKALIAAAAVQLTFGLPDVILLHFDKILVYPDTYYSTLGRQYHKGEVNPRMGIIVLSWKAFVSGYADPHDGINLGLHEMVHALKFENVIRNGEHHFFNLEEYKKWLDLAKKEIAKIRSGEQTIFRDYAGENEDEFFATCIEVYFEQPHRLYRYNRQLYTTLSNLLNQDTIRLIPDTDRPDT